MSSSEEQPTGGAAVFPSRMVFVGTGVSTAIPVIGHDGNDPPCACKDALANPDGPNRRNNVSLLIQQGGANVLIDAGKTFRDAYFRQLHPRKVRDIHALLLTHDHADAMLGVDDLRDLQTIVPWEKGFKCTTPTTVYLAQRTLATMNEAFGYVMRHSTIAGRATEDDTHAPSEVFMERRVACLRLRMVEESIIEPMVFRPGVLDDLPFYSVPVFHGGEYICLGYAFGKRCSFLSVDQPAPNRQTYERDAEGEEPAEAGCVLYLSDISGVPQQVEPVLDRIAPIDLLAIDLLLPGPEQHFSHFNLEDAWQFIVRMQPRRAVGVGMYCALEHHETCKLLEARLAAYRLENPQSRIESVSLAYDGLEWPIA